MCCRRWTLWTTVDAGVRPPSWHHAEAARSRTDPGGARSPQIPTHRRSAVPPVPRPGPYRVQLLEQVVRDELDLLVTPLRGAVMAGDDPHAVQAAEVAVDKAYRALALSFAPSVSPRCHAEYSSHVCRA